MDAVEIEFWYWWVAAAVFVGLEIVSPGVAFLWLGIAAAAVGAILLVVPAMGLSVQILVFAILAVAAVYAGRQIFRPRAAESDHPSLNRRAETYVGRTVTLTTAIVNGTGRAAIGDGVWTVRGDDMPAGSLVRITGADGTVLIVERSA